MKYNAIGVIEVFGVSDAVLAADTMCKSADIKVKTWDYLCGGRIVVFLYGDTSSVTEAIQTLKDSKCCELYMSAVMSNPSDELSRIMEAKAIRFGKFS